MSSESSELYLENQICFPLYAASRLIVRRYTPFLNELDITYPQYLVLLVLWQHGEQSVSAIGNCLLLESNTLTPLLKRLEEKGLISRKRSSQDERQVKIDLTEKGQHLKSKASTIPLRMAEAYQDKNLSDSELKDLRDTLSRILETLKD